MKTEHVKFPIAISLSQAEFDAINDALDLAIDSVEKSADPSLDIVFIRRLKAIRSKLPARAVAAHDAKKKAKPDFWATMNRLAYEERAKKDRVSVAEARRRIIAGYAKDHRISFDEAAARSERPDGAR